MAAKGTIYGINGPIVYIAGDSGFQMNEMVYVGEANLVGEVIGLTSEKTTIEVYEETTGLKPGEPVTGTGAPVSVTLAPGIITNIFDGIERPLAAIKKSSGYYIDRGVHVTSLDTEKKWQTHMTVKRGDHVYGGTIIAEVPIDGFTNEQRFYLGYANLWAQNIRPEEILRLTKIDPHSLGKWRVNAALRNIDAFYSAFDIKEGEPMYMLPADQVVIW